MSLHMQEDENLDVTNSDDPPQLRCKTFDVEEKGVKLKLSVAETIGFGDQLDKVSSVKTVIEYLDAQFEGYMQEEMKIKRRLSHYADTRIHACIFFISPTGHGLKSLDREVMKQLSLKANVIPVIAKSDTVSKDELLRFKAKILTDLKNSSINYYSFPTDDESYAELNAALNAAIPFAVIGSTEFIENDNKKVRARRYPWGVVEVENEEHCDFVKLREALVRTNIQDLATRTHSVHYERFRRQRLTAMGVKEGDLGTGIANAYKERKTKHLAQMQASERELKESFLGRVKTKEDELKRQEKELQRKVEVENQRFQQEMAELEKENARLDNEISEFHRLKNMYTASQQQATKRKR